MPELLSTIIQQFKDKGEGESFWHDIVETIGEGLFILDKNNTIVYWNSSAAEITGYTADEVLGKPCITGLRCQNCLKECSLVAHGKIDSAEISILHKNGSTIYVRKNGRLLKTSDGEVIGGVETFRDISDDKAHIADVERHKHILETVINSMVEGAIACNNELKVVSFSRRAEEITGFSETDVIGRNIVEVLGGDIVSRFDMIKQIFAGNAENKSLITSIHDKRGIVVPIEATANPLVDSGGAIKGGLLLIRNIESEVRLNEMMRSQYRYHQLVGKSEAMQKIFDIIEQVAPTDANVLITGESGTGKELVARAIHLKSGRAENPFVAINCAALPSELLESELFGYERGAFTGAVQQKRGRFELAEGGTLFLDEIGEMPLNMQAKLLRVLEERAFMRVGGTKNVSVDVRIISATNKKLEELVSNNLFREDLFYRLKVVPIHIPPLRERREDIELIAMNYLEEQSKKKNIVLKGLSQAVRTAFYYYPWRGNVRELINILEYALTMSKGNVVELFDLPLDFQQAVQIASAISGTKRNFNSLPSLNVTNTTGLADERETIVSALTIAGGNRSKAASLLGMDRTTLWRKMKKLGIES